MKKLFSSINVAEVGLLKGLFEAQGIPCATRNQHLSIASGSVPFVECYPELWVLNDEDFARAQELLAQWQDPESQEFESWVCPGCGEENEGQFAACWRCEYVLGCCAWLGCVSYFQKANSTGEDHEQSER